MIYVICDCCIPHLVIWFYIGTYFLRYIHELISFIHFIHGTRFHSFMSCYCIVDIWLLLDMIGMFHIILLWVYPYVIPTFHVVIIHR
nr:MAG TPA: hypothetical protein [Caudoviricetes sp.]